MPPPITSFYHAIYKRLWTVGVSAGGAHTTVVGGDGNFSLNAPGPPNGIFGMTDYGAPLALGVFDATQNPLWVILNASFNPPPPPDYLVAVPGAGMWPAMPWPAYAPYPLWDQYNNAAPGQRLIDRLQHWIEQDQQFNDTPGGSHLEFADWSGGPQLVPQPKGKEEQVLFVCSKPGDNGVRPGSIDPNNYWNSSQIFVCNEHGQNIGLPKFKATEQRIIHAIIGNSSGLLAGTINSLPPVEVRCNAYTWNTHMSPGTPLPEMSALDAPNAGVTYEQPHLAPTSYAVAGFRFDVDKVFKGLRDAIVAAGITPAQLGFATIDDYLKANDTHACVKVLVRANEYPNHVNGGFPDDAVALPTSDRHIAQRNLAGFDMSVVGMKKIKWQTFMMSQAGAGTNALAIHQAWSTGSKADAARFYLALPPQMFERYVAKAKGTRGFQVVHDAAPKPFPDAVILRETAPGARLEILDHARERYFAMALGIEGDPARLKSVRGDLSVVHTAHDGHVVGGFTLRPQRA